MWTRTYNKVFANVSSEAIWQLWTDVNNWPNWHGDLEYCKLEGSFVVGNNFMLKPKGVRAVKITLVEIDKGRKFTDCTSFPGAKMYDTHALEKTPQGIKLTNTLVVTGPLRWVWIKLVAKNVAATIPEEMEALVKLARERGEE